jgi:hypothetical protein
MSIEFSPAFDSGRSSLPAPPPPRISRGMGASPMQPAAPAAPRQSKKRLKPQTHGRGAHATGGKPSARRVAANRRNAQRSTGPRTEAGKRRAARNAIKHGLCSPRACLPGECPATYATFVREIEEELQPRTAMQHALIPHIANLMWRMNRLPQAQADMFDLELRKVRGRRAPLSASEVIARRFSDDPTRNGFLLIGRYERGLHNELHRLLSRYDTMQRRRPTTPWPHDEPPVPDEMQRPAWTDEMLQRQVAAFDERAKRTQSNPTQNRSGESETGKCANNDDAPVTKRTHCDARHVAQPRLGFRSDPSAATVDQPPTVSAPKPSPSQPAIAPPGGPPTM